MPQGSGKTHTLLGDVSCARERGVVPRAVAELARGIAEYPDRCQFKVDGCSVFTLPEHPAGIKMTHPCQATPSKPAAAAMQQNKCVVCPFASLLNA